MSVRLNDDDMGILAAMETQAAQGEIGYWQIYDWLGKRLMSHGMPATDPTVLWLRGATEANAGRGSMSSLIRVYTETQHLLRYGVGIPEDAMQPASDKVAKNLLDDLMGRNEPGWQKGMVPDIDRIAEADATAVGDALFSPAAGRDPEDSAFLNNSAWSGTLLFSLLTSDQTGRLVRTGEAPDVVDSLMDARDILYAFISYAEGLKAAALEHGTNLLISQTGTPEQRASAARQIAVDKSILAPTVWGYVSSPGTLGQLFDTVATGAGRGPATDAFSTLARIGPAMFLDMLMGARQGTVVLGRTNESNLVENARSFFNQFSVTQLRSLPASFLPMEPGSLASMGRVDENTRAALAALSVVRVDTVAKSSAALSLYDPETGNGAISDQWLLDRAMLLTAVSARGQLEGVADHPALPTDRAYEFHYIDGSGVARILIAENTARFGGTMRPVPRQEVYFGGNGSDQFVAQAGNALGVRIFGGAGDDTLSGADNSDYLEGNSGNDTLLGGGGGDALIGGDGNDILRGSAGTDLLIGGTGDDELNGGSDNDELHGGNGNDTYVFQRNSGADVAVDSDGIGKIIVEGIGALPAGTKLAANAYMSEDRRVFYSLINAELGQQDLIVTFSDRPDSITIRNWSTTRNLGITLTELPAPSPATFTLLGDFQKKVSDDGEQYVLDDRGNYESTGIADEGAADLIHGSSQRDFVFGFDGDDGLQGLAGDDWIDGGDGHDVIFGGYGKDTIFGGDGDDAVYGSSTGGFYRPTSTSYVPPPTDVPAFAFGFSWRRYLLSSDEDGFLTSAFAGDMDRSTLVDDDGNVIDGGAGNDFILAGTGRDVVSGGDDDDQIWGMALGDQLYGDAGNDRIYGDGTVRSGGWLYQTAGDLHGADFISGGSGNDILIGQGGSDVIYGGDDDDQVWGDDRILSDTPPEFHGNDLLDGGNGNDLLIGGGGADVISGGAGNDQLVGDSAGGALDGQYHSDDSLDGGEGDDNLFGNGGNDALRGGGGNDVLIGDDHQAVLSVEFHGNDKLDGGIGDDFLLGSGGDDDLRGGEGNDDLYGDDEPANLLEGEAHGSDRLDGGAGADYLWGGGGSDALHGGDGDDQLAGDAAEAGLAPQFHGDDYLDGGNGNDRLFGYGGNDWLAGGAGDDEIAGDASIADLAGQYHGDDRLEGGDGNDRMWGGGGDDYLFGGAGSDELYGDDIELGANFHRSDHLYGGDGDDALFGYGGDDHLDGGSGADLLDGGDGNDALVVGDGDVAKGGRGNDTFYASGNARVDGGSGQNTLVIAGDSRSITVEDGAGDWKIVASHAVAIESVSILGNGSNGSRGLSIGGTQIVGSSLKASDLQSIALNDGGVLDLTGIIRHSNVAFNERLLASGTSLVTGAAADALSIEGAGNTVEASGGDDTIYVRASNTTLRQKTADGHDRVVVSVPEIGPGEPLIILLDAGVELSNVPLSVETGPNGVHLVRLSWSEAASIFFEAGQGTLEEAMRRVQLQSGDQQLGLWQLFQSVPRTLEGTEGHDSNLQGTSHQDRIFAKEGYDTVYAQDGDDLVDGGSGGDVIFGGSGDDTLVGGEGDDRLHGDAGNDQLRGGEGDDWIDGGAGADIYDGGAGDNEYVDSTGEDTFVLSSDGLSTVTIDPATGQFNVLKLVGLTPADVRFVREGGAVTVQIASGTTIGRILGASADFVGFSTIEFADGTSWQGAKVAEVLLGAPGGQVLLGTEAGDELTGGAGDDLILGRDGADALLGGAGRDELRGGSGNDVLSGGSGNDQLLGDDGEDRLSGGEGLNVLNGGAGTDIFVLGEHSGRSIIVDDANTFNRIALAPGQQLSSLRLELRGAGLAIISANGDELHIGDYATAEAGYGLWEVAEHEGPSKSLAELVSEQPPETEDYALYRRAALAEVDQLRPRTLSQYEYPNREITLSYGHLDVNRKEVSGAGHINVDAEPGLTERVNGSSTTIGYSTMTQYVPRTVRETVQQTVLEYGVVGYEERRYPVGISFSFPLGSILTYVEVETPSGPVTTEVVVSTPKYGYVSREITVTQDRTVYEPVMVTRPTESTTVSMSAVVTEHDIRGSAGNDRIVIGQGGTTWLGFGRVLAGDGNDVVQAHANWRPTQTFDYTNSSDYRFVQLPRTGMYLDGGNGNDSLGGAEGHDVLVGGAGDDVLGGGGGNDTYVVGQGHDWVADFSSVNTGGIDKVVLPDTITRESIVVSLVDWLPAGATGDAAASPIKALRLQWSEADSVTIALPAFDGVEEHPYEPGMASPGVEVVVIGGQEYRVSDLLALTGSVPTSGGDDLLIGTVGNDELIGGAGSDVLLGGDGADLLVGDRAVLGSRANIDDMFDDERGHTYGGSGDTFVGGRGNDLVWLTHGDDTVRFELGDGVDTYTSWGRDIVQFYYGPFGDESVKGLSRSSLLGLAPDGSLDTVQFGADVRPEDLRFEVQIDSRGYVGPGKLIVHVGNQGDQMHFVNAVGSPIRFRFADGTERVIGETEQERLIRPNATTVFDTRELFAEFPDGQPVSVALRGDEMPDLETATDGITFDAASGQLTFNEGYSFTTGSSLRLAVTFQYGLESWQTITRYVEVHPAGAAPQAAAEIADAQAVAGQAIAIDVSGNAFTEADGDALTWSARLESGESLPEWLSFDAQARRFTGTPPLGFAGVLSIHVAAADADGVASQVFQLQVQSASLPTTEGTADADVLLGTEDAEMVLAGGGNDFVLGYGGHDVLHGQDGDDTLRGGDGNDTLLGGAGYDSLAGHEGDDIMDGGAGDDTLVGGAGNDVYRWGRGMGGDTIVNDDPTPGRLDVVEMLAGVAPADVELLRWGSSLALRLTDTGETLLLADALSDQGDGAGVIDEVRFDDGTVWTSSQMRASLLEGTASHDQIFGFASDDTIHAGAGSDYVAAGAGNDHVIGGGGNDFLLGEGGNDVLEGGDDIDKLSGGEGDDTLLGGAGDDTYFMERGGGRDRIVEDDASPGNADVLSFGADIGADQLWFRQEGADLEIGIVGTADLVAVNGWYNGAAHRVELFQSGDGKVLQASQVQALVDAMAGFAPPAAGQTTLPQGHRDALQGVIAANWN